MLFLCQLHISIPSQAWLRSCWGLGKGWGHSCPGGEGLLSQEKNGNTLQGGKESAFGPEKSRDGRGGFFWCHEVLVTLAGGEVALLLLPVWH